MTKRDIAAFLLGVFAVLAVERYIAIEYQLSQYNLHIAAIEGFLEQATRGR
jgi:hypothetical protein